MHYKRIISASLSVSIELDFNFVGLTWVRRAWEPCNRVLISSIVNRQRFHQSRSKRGCSVALASKVQWLKVSVKHCILSRWSTTLSTVNIIGSNDGNPESFVISQYMGRLYLTYPLSCFSSYNIMGVSFYCNYQLLPILCVIYQMPASEKKTPIWPFTTRHPSYWPVCSIY